MKDLYDILREFKRCPNEPFVLATLVRVDGSSYRRPGARMSIYKDRPTIGSVSAGCIEEEVEQLALEVFRTGLPILANFDTRERFGCHGRIDIHLEFAPTRFLRDVSKDLEERCAHNAVTAFESGELIETIQPPIRLVIVGTGPDNVPLHQLGSFLGWQTMEVEHTDLLTIRPDERTAAIVKSHNYGRDFTALQKLLPWNFRYVGLVGPRKRRDQLLGDLLGLGITINAGFFSPAGIDLGSETPQEISLAIVAEIQRVFAESSGVSLRERKNRIHALAG